MNNVRKKRHRKSFAAYRKPRTVGSSIYRFGRLAVTAFLWFLVFAAIWACASVMYPNSTKIYASSSAETTKIIQDDSVFLDALMLEDINVYAAMTPEDTDIIQAKANALVRTYQVAWEKELAPELSPTDEETTIPELNSSSGLAEEEDDVLCAAHEPVKPFDVPLSVSLQNYICELADEYEIPAALIIAVINYESNFDSNAISETNDYGLMQINEINFDWLQEELGTIDFLDPFENVEAGIYLLSEFYHKYPESIHLALMAYNMGEAGAQQEWRCGIYSTTYSRDIVELYASYEN